MSNKELIEKLRFEAKFIRGMGMAGIGGSRSALLEQAAEALSSAEAERERLREALEQVEDDMGEDGLSVCLATKKFVRSALSSTDNSNA